MKHILSWHDGQSDRQATWVTESHLSPPKKILVADDELKADTFYQMASQGTAYVWQGDFHNAKQLLQAVGRRIDKSADKKTDRTLTKKSDPAISTKNDSDSTSNAEIFHRYRQKQAHRAQLLSKLLLYVTLDFRLELGRAPDVSEALRAALDIETVTALKPKSEALKKNSGDPASTNQLGFLISLRELLGIIGAYEWQKKGVYIEALQDRIHPRYGLFSPGRGEYLDLVSKAPLPENCRVAVDVGTGTGVLAAILAKRGVEKVIALETDPRAVVCAKENIERLGFAQQVEVLESDMFSALAADISRTAAADLILCNPPWLPVRATTRLERGLYDENSQMLKNFLNSVAQHLNEKGEAWLILSDLAERLGLRASGEVENLIHDGGLEVIEILTARPQHEKAQDVDDPLHFARSQEVTKLWRLRRIG